MVNNNSDINKENGSANIFDDFAQDSTLVKEVDKLKKESIKDKFFYFSRAAYYLQTSFWVLFFIFLMLITYIYIQNREDFSDSNIIDPICFVFLWDVVNEGTFCSSISHLNLSYKTRLETLKKSQATDTLSILEKLYEVENFTKSKEIIFLWDKSSNKLKVLGILEEFDNLKNDFDKLDKEKIQCDGLTIDSSKNLLTMNCSAFSAWYEKWFKWFDAGSDNFIKWTSISIANSFLNFINKTSKVFIIEDRQKVFKSESIVWDKTDFTNKTTFNLKLKYNLK